MALPKITDFIECYFDKDCLPRYFQMDLIEW